LHLSLTLLVASSQLLSYISFYIVSSRQPVMDSLYPNSPFQSQAKHTKLRQTPPPGPKDRRGPSLGAPFHVNPSQDKHTRKRYLVAVKRTSIRSLSLLESPERVIAEVVVLSSIPSTTVIALRPTAASSRAVAVALSTAATTAPHLLTSTPGHVPNLLLLIGVPVVLPMA
jgi:hypothetical protein